MLVQKVKFGAHVRHAALGVASTGLGQESLAFMLSQVADQGGQIVGDVVRHAFGVCTAVVCVEILVDVEHEFVSFAVGIFDGGKGRCGIVNPAAYSGVTCAREQDRLRGGAGFADGVNHLLKSISPRNHLEIMGFVDKAKDDFRLGSIFGGELGPERDKISVWRATLTNNSAIPACVVVDIDDARSASFETCLDNAIVCSQELGVEVRPQSITDKGLPSNRKTEHVQFIVFYKMLHLRWTRYCRTLSFAQITSTLQKSVINVY